MKAAKRSSVAARSRVAGGGAPPAPHARTGSKRRAAAARRGTRMARQGGDARPSTKRRRDNGRPSTLARPAFAAPPAKHAAAPIKERATIVCRRGARMPLVARTLSRGSPPGGIIRCGEAPLDAARRALEEQTRLAGLELMYFFGSSQKTVEPWRTIA
ncbi:NUDIX domain-containing protein [Burkholderia pseudomallei]|uniref:NUDIX domain-containing protein n=1 Tax=Burkholderia pseudomallei TaxID=28450 RepID=UPI001E2906EC|nr:NUDIX domain-containing protein [Burkholderia pseudomallei]